MNAVIPMTESNMSQVLSFWRYYYYYYYYWCKRSFYASKQVFKGLASTPVDKKGKGKFSYILNFSTCWVTCSSGYYISGTNNCYKFKIFIYTVGILDKFNKSITHVLKYDENIYWREHATVDLPFTRFSINIFFYK